MCSTGVSEGGKTAFAPFEKILFNVSSTKIIG